MDRDAIAQRRAERREQERRRRQRAARRRIGAFVVVPLVLVGGYLALARMTAPALGARGPAVRVVGAAQLGSLRFSAAREATWKVDGESAGRGRTCCSVRFADGEHRVTASSSGSLPGSGTSHTWRFVVDTTPPKVTLTPRNAAFTRGTPLRLRGTLEQGARVWVDGKQVEVKDGAFEVTLTSLAGGTIPLLARDAAGNEWARMLHPQLSARRPGGAIRAVHVTAAAWAVDFLRDPVLKLIDEGKINAVQLDLKDEAGEVGYDTRNAIARRIGANTRLYDLPTAVRQLHAKGVRVIGRIVAFRDPLYAGAAWKAGRRDEVVQTSSGGPYTGAYDAGGYAFTNFANGAVQQYNIALAKEAAEAGVDEILYDYVRRPDGPLSSMRFPGLTGTPEQAIVRFLRNTRRALPTRTYLGASVFGVAATRPLEVAQDIPRMAREVDYIAPMVYPSHWGPGEYDVASPNAQPYDIVLASIRDFQKDVRGSGARVVPWLQDFTLGITYGPREVRAQIDAAAKAGAPEFILWDPLVTYTADALAGDAPKVQVVATPPAAASAPPATTQATETVANELGVVPILMFHQIRADGGGDFDLTPAEFRRELQRLYDLGFRPVTAADYAAGTIDLEAGESPVVLTFDDSTKEQLAWDAKRRVKPDTAVGIMLAFARKHPDFEPAGTFYVNREPFAGVKDGPEMLRWLHAHGFEIGNHTKDHVPYNELRSNAEWQREIVLGNRLIRRWVPEQKDVTTLALPLGVMPKPETLALRGEWDGERYAFNGVLLVGAEPAPSPFARRFDPNAVPRIRACESTKQEDFCSAYWLPEIVKAKRQYVSDGNASKVTFPRDLEQYLRPRFAARAATY